MRFITFLLSALMLIWSCSTGKTKKAGPSSVEQLRSKVANYEMWFSAKQDEFGFIETSTCDSLIFTGLSNPRAKLTAAELEPGRWLRRPTTYPECWSSGKSRSEISRDGLLGVIWWSLENKDLGTLMRLWAYGENHGWIMAPGGWQHTIMSPAHISLLAQAIYHLSNGEHDYAARRFRYPYLAAGDGFEGHLQVIQLLIQRKVYGGMLETDKLIVKKLAENNPHNPLMAYMNGEHERAIGILLNTFPNGRVPNTSDWCATWYNEQSTSGTGLTPCPEEAREHSGGDFLFVAKLILKEY